MNVNCEDSSFLRRASRGRTGQAQPKNIMVHGGESRTTFELLHLLTQKECRGIWALLPTSNVQLSIVHRSRRIPIPRFELSRILRSSLMSSSTPPEARQLHFCFLLDSVNFLSSFHHLRPVGKECDEVLIFHQCTLKDAFCIPSVTNGDLCTRHII